MKTTLEVIDVNRHKEDARFEALAEENARLLRLDADARVLDAEQKEDKRIQERDKGRRFLEHSGVMEELNAIKSRHLDGKHPKIELFTDFMEDLHCVTVTLVWGKAFKVKELSGGRHVIKDTGGINPKLDAWYFTVELYPDTRGIAVCVSVDSGHYHRVHKEWNTVHGHINQDVRNSLANAFAASGKVRAFGH